MLRQRPLIAVAIVVFLVAAIAGGIYYYQILQSRIYIEKSEIYAPVISLSPDFAGTIDEIYIKEGDVVQKDQPLFKVGNHLLTASTGGIIVWFQNTPGQMAGPTTVIVKMVDPSSLRVIGHVEEDKGLSDIHPGQRVIFTIDAFDAVQYEGTVQSIANIADTSSVAFSISDKRAENIFDVTVAYDVTAHPELKDGMSAKMWIYK